MNTDLQHEHEARIAALEDARCAASQRCEAAGARQVEAGQRWLDALRGTGGQPALDAAQAEFDEIARQWQEALREQLRLQREIDLEYARLDATCAEVAH
jgi:hypothetical protein